MTSPIEVLVCCTCTKSMIVLAETDSNSQHIDAVRNVDVSIEDSPSGERCALLPCRGISWCLVIYLQGHAGVSSNNTLSVLLNSEFSQGTGKGGGKYA